MSIQLRPELEELIRQDIQRGLYSSVDEFVERAVRLLHDQETWLDTHRNAISMSIEEGWKSAERGDLIDEEKVQANIKARKQAWLDKHRRA
jgi:antitoxin ParD1/3/4